MSSGTVAYSQAGRRSVSDDVMAVMLAAPTLAAVPDRPRDDARGVLSRPADGPDIVLRVADHDDGVAEVFLPPAVGNGFGPPDGSSTGLAASTSAAGPLLYALHGGFWRADFDRRHLRPLAVALRARGWVVVLPEYARVGGARPGARWPLLVDDLRTVRRRVPGLLAEVAPGRVAPGAPVLVGHSAGGQLALWWALDAAGEPDGVRPRHVLALAPVADLRRATAERLGDDAVAALLGGGSRSAPAGVGEPDVAARLRAGEHPAGCRVVVLHGEEDLQVPVAHSTDLGADVPTVDVRQLPGVEHFALIDPLSAAWPDVVATLPPRSSLDG